MINFVSTLFSIFLNFKIDVVTNLNPLISVNNFFDLFLIADSESLICLSVIN